MKLKASFNDQEQDVVIDRNGDGYNVEVDGRRYTIQVRNPDASTYLILNSDKVYESRVERIQPGSRDHFMVNLRGKRRAITIIDPRRLRTDENSDRHHHGPTEIAAQMPGKVVRVLVEEGSAVEKGTGVLVVEAMKMQNEMKSPRAGVVVSIKVKPGDTVNAGEVLATVGEE